MTLDAMALLAKVSLRRPPAKPGPGHQLTVTKTAWASVMRRIAADRLGAVSEDQSDKVRCRSAVGRVVRLSTRCGR